MSKCNCSFRSSTGEVSPGFLKQLRKKAVKKPWWTKRPEDTTLEECQHFAYGNLLLSKNDVRKHGSLAKKGTFVKCFITKRNAPYNLLDEVVEVSLSTNKSATVCLANQISEAKVVKQSKPTAKKVKKPSLASSGNGNGHAGLVQALQRKTQSAEAKQNDSEVPDKDKYGQYILDSSTSRKVLAHLCHENGIKPIERGDKSLWACWWNTLAEAGFISGIGKSPAEVSQPLPTKGSDGMYANFDLKEAERYVLIRLCLDEGVAPEDWKDVSHQSIWWLNKLACHGFVSGIEVPFEKRLGDYRKLSEKDLPEAPYTMEYLRGLGLCELTVLARKNNISSLGSHPVCFIEAFRLTGLTDERWPLIVNRKEPVKTAHFLSGIAKIMGLPAPEGAGEDDLETWIGVLAKAEHPIILDFVQDRQNDSSKRRKAPRKKFVSQSIRAPQFGCK